MTASAELIDLLAGIVGSDHVLVDADVTARYRVDWTRRFHCGPVPVVRPESTDEVCKLVSLANAFRFPVVPQGGNTGLVGGGIPVSAQGVVLSTERLLEVGEIDALSAQIIVGAGVILGDLQRRLRGSGFMFGVDLGARDSCTIGGMVATNAGGINVLRYGTMRRQVVGIEAVLGDGTVVSHLTGLEKDNTGYDLEGLLAGSEGTLGVITRVLLRLFPEPKSVATAFLSFDGVAEAVEGASLLKRTLSSLEALEFMLEPGLRLVERVHGFTFPRSTIPKAVLLVEASGAAAVVDDLGSACSQLSSLLSAEPAVAVGPTGRAALWRWREEHTASIATLGVPLKLDVSLPPRSIAEFLIELDSLSSPSPAIVFGHLGDGNLHVNFPACFPSSPTELVPAWAHVLEHDVLQLVTNHGGSISAEHGIGVAKVPYLSMTRSAGEIAAFRNIKRACDPNHVLNPGVLLAD